MGMDLQPVGLTARRVGVAAAREINTMPAVRHSTRKSGLSGGWYKDAVVSWRL
jgi:hypothetical protein